MKPSIVILPVLLALAGFSHAENKTIYKCADTDYRDTPCATQQEQTTLISPTWRASWQNENAKAIQPTDARLAATPFFATRLFIGMTDTQVLNLPSWGRPAQIIRSKAGHVWREQWIYKDRSTGDERGFLYFENARLVDQEDAPPQPSFQARATTE
jgi:hypothetical protein